MERQKKRDPDIRAMVSGAHESDGHHGQMESAHRRVAERGPLAVCIVEHALPDDAKAIIHLGADSPADRFMVIHAQQFEDELYLRAVTLALQFEIEHLERKEPVRLTIQSDYVVEVDPPELGLGSSGFWLDTKLKNGRNYVRSMLKAARRAPVVTVPNIGLARLVRPKT